MANHKRVTLRTVARHVGLSVSTVSRVISGQAKQYRISKDTEEVVLCAVNELHYTPDRLAQSLRLKKTHTIGLIIPDISNPFFSTIAHNIEKYARKRGYSIILCDSQENHELELESLDLLQSRKVDGLIVCPVGLDGKHFERLLRQNIPLVVVDRHFPDIGADSVISDNYSGSVAAVTHFVENGHRAIACIQGLPKTFVNDERVRGYKDALKMHGIPFDGALLVGRRFGLKNGYLGSKLLFNRDVRPTAILALSNLISLGVLQAISEKGLNVPDDISIISFDDQPYSDYLTPPMTTIAQQNSDMGRISCRLLLEQIESNLRADRSPIILPIELMKRGSVKKIT